MQTNKIKNIFSPAIDFFQARKLYWSGNNGPIGIKSSSNEQIGNKKGSE
jgi:hypothetical protein